MEVDINCNSTGMVCSGRGVCVGNGTEAARCVCPNYYEPSTHCATTFFESWGTSMIALSAVSIAAYALLLLVALLELIPDLRRLSTKKVVSTPFVLSKVFLIVTIVTFIVEFSWFIINGQGGNKVVLDLMRTVAQALYITLLLVYLTMILFSWIEIIERARSLDRARWLWRVRLVTIVALVVMCVFNIIITPLRLSASSDAVFDSLTLYQNVIDTVYIIYLLIISVVALVRGRDWWASKDSAVIIKQLKKKVKWFIATLVSLVCFVIIAVVQAGIKSNSTIFFIFKIFYNIEFFFIMVVSFAFIQRNIYQSKGWFVHYLSSTSGIDNTSTAVNESLRNKNSRSTGSTQTMPNNKSLPSKDATSSSGSSSGETSAADAQPAAEMEEVTSSVSKSSSTPKVTASS